MREKIFVLYICTYILKREREKTEIRKNKGDNQREREGEETNGKKILRLCSQYNYDILKVWD